MDKVKRKVTIQLPEEFVKLCNYDMVCPTVVLRGFIADLCGIINWVSNPRADGYSSNGSDERGFARQYYDRVGYPYEAQWVRDNYGQTKPPSFRTAGSDAKFTSWTQPLKLAKSGWNPRVINGLYRKTGKDINEIRKEADRGSCCGQSGDGA